MTQSNRISPDQVPQSMTLHDDYVPGILDGAYRLVVQQTVNFGGPEIHYYQDRRFVVVGPRYALPPDDVHARFPPANGSGDYKHILPHIVLRKRGLPWERPVWGTGKDAEPAPWLTLLVLTQDELNTAADQLGLAAAQDDGDAAQANPLLSTTTPHALVSPENSQIARPDGGITLLPALDEEGDGDDTKTTVQVVDLTLDLFKSVCPPQEDLVYLAHVRTVDAQDKVPLNMHAVGDFSVIVGNRFPQPGSNVVFLVSLEGWGGLLDGERKPTLATDRVRLVLFDSWTFNDDEAGVHTFGDLMEGLDVAPLQAIANSGDEKVDAALMHGYVPLSYQPWRSEPTFGWYRGPFSPAPVASLGIGVGLFHRADAALVFDQTSGLFDLSYAAAWQLGRLTALSAPAVANDLRAFLHQHKDAFAVAKAVEDFLAVHRLAVGRVWDDEMVELREHLASLSDPDEHRALMEELRAAGFTKAQCDLLAQAAPPPATDQRTTKDSEIEVADTLLHFFGRLGLLYPVPTDYLVAHPSLMPPESMRFFYIDNNWLDALLEGALSIALDGSRDGQSDVTVTARANLHAALSRLVYQYRRHLQGLLEHVDPQYKPPATYIDESKTGFLLRSEAICGWPGLEIACYDADLQKMPVLRLDHLGDDLMLCIASGHIQHVVIREPSEGLRFGVDHEARVMLRHWKDKPFGAPIQIHHHEHKWPEEPDEIGIYEKGTPGVLAIAALAKDLAGAVSNLESKGTDGFGPAAFASQMTRSPEKQQVDVGQHAEGDMIEEKHYDG